MKIFSEEDIGKSFKITVSNSMGSDDITVSVKNIVDLIIETPAKTTYQLFDNLELAGIRVYGVYDDDTIEELFNYEVDESDFNTHILDKPVCDIKILYGDIEKSFEVNVLEEIGVNGDNYGFITEWNAFDGVFNMESGYSTDKYIVDWGDGVTQRFNGTMACSHTYSVSEPRFIKFYFNKYNLEMFVRTNLKRVLNWNENPSRYSFYGCTNLLSLPENQSMKIPNDISSISSMFYRCSSLMFIPEKLFDDVSFIKVTNIGSIFESCSSLVSVPSKLFKNFFNLTHAGNAFSRSGIVSVGDDLFCNSILLSNVNAIFRNCSNLETVGANLFKNSPNLNNLRDGFNNCLKLKSVGDGFINSIDVRDFYGLFLYTPIESLPIDLFERAYLMEYGYIRYCFEDSLSENTVIPEKFFENLLWLDTASYIFQRSKVKSIPKNLFSENISLVNVEYLFYDSYVENVGENIFKDCPRLYNIQGCFYNCYNLKNIHQSVFKDCENVVNIDYCFHYCISVIEFPDFLFYNQKQLIGCSYVFYNCESLAATPKYLFCESVRSVSSIFTNCYNLSTFRKETFEYAYNLSNFNTVFYNCYNINFISKDVFKYCLILEHISFGFSDNSSENWECILESGIFDNNVELNSLYLGHYDVSIVANTNGFIYNNNLLNNNFLLKTFLLNIYTSLDKELFKNLSILETLLINQRNGVEIAEDLLWENQNLKSIRFCGRIQNIGEGIFSKHLNLTNADFKNSDLVAIPAGLFDNNIKLKSFSFENCRELLTIPENLFINNINLESCLYGFYNCKNLSLPANLFNTAAIQSKKPEFYRCFGVDNSIDSPTGTAYPLWNNITLTSRNYCYQNCSNLSNFGTIPFYWK